MHLMILMVAVVASVARAEQVAVPSAKPTPAQVRGTYETRNQDGWLAQVSIKPSAKVRIQFTGPGEDGKTKTTIWNGRWEIKDDDVVVKFATSWVKYDFHRGSVDTLVPNDASKDNFLENDTLYRKGP